MKIEVPKFATNKELFAHLKANEEDFIYQKKASLKCADGLDLGFIPMIEMKAQKSDGGNEPNVFKVRAVINTTYIRDSHKDVHIDGLWKKSLSENKRIKHLQEHDMAFSKIISDKDDLKAYTKTYSWKDLGFDAEGETQALVFDSNVKESRNPQMYKEYKEGNVDNHSVGMYYVKMALAFNSEEEGDEKYKEEYDKHIDKIVNRDEVAKEGYFWAVYEAKAIEGSAVPMGSNPITPSLTRRQKSDEKTEEQKAIEKWLLS